MACRRRRVALVASGLLLGLVGLVVGLAFYGASLLEREVEASIERVGTRLLGAPVSVGDVELSPFDGRGEIEALVAASPPGFDAPELLRVTRTRLHVDPWSLIEDEGPILVHEARIEGTTLTVEAYGAKTSLGAIKTRLEATRGGGGEAKAGGRAGGEGRLLRIERLRLEDTRVAVVFHGRRRTVKRSLLLPDVEMTGLGGARGAPPREIAGEVTAVLGRKARAAILGSEGPWSKLRDAFLRGFEELGDADRARLRETGEKLEAWRKAGKSLRELRDAVKAARRPDGGPLR